MARRAQAWCCTRLFRVPCSEPATVQTCRANLVETHAPGESGDGHTMASGARPLAVARRAEVARACRAGAVLAQPVAIVHEVARGQSAFGREVDVATVAIARRPLVLVLMTPKAGRHLRTQCLRAGDTDLAMTTHAVAAGCRHVRAMIELQMLARHLGAHPHERLAVTITTRARVVRLLVAVNAVGLGGQMQLALVLGAHDPGVARETVDSLEHVGAVLERMGRRAPRTENAGACGQRQRQDEQRGSATRHGTSSARLTRTSALVSNA